MNYRGIECELKTPRTYCATNFEDLHLVIQHVHSQYKDHKIFAVGVSLGGIKLGGYLSKHADDCLISYAMIVSAPFNIFHSAEEMELPRYFYTFNKQCTRRLVAYYTRNRLLFESDVKFDCEAISQATCIRDFDTMFVIKQFGYASCDDYYRDACLDSKIQNINVPTLFLNAEDDMFSPGKVFPIEKIRANPYLAMVWTKYGGHISFCEGLVPNGCNYACRILTEYLQQVLIEEGMTEAQ
jgi:predicted alpha/beta-fold hydrolase